jgi:hypothetical protein
MEVDKPVLKEKKVKNVAVGKRSQKKIANVERQHLEDQKDASGSLLSTILKVLGNFFVTSQIKFTNFCRALCLSPSSICGSICAF